MGRDFDEPVEPAFTDARSAERVLGKRSDA
jgi:hypothetical protein